MPSNICKNTFVIQPQPNLLKQHPELKHAANTLALKYAFNELVVEMDGRDWRSRWKLTNLKFYHCRVGGV